MNYELPPSAFPIPPIYNAMDGLTQEGEKGFTKLELATLMILQGMMASGFEPVLHERNASAVKEAVRLARMAFIQVKAEEQR